MVYDLHLHSTYSDGDLAPAAMVQAAAERGLAGISLTDHNGLWGLTELAAAARAQGLTCLEGIEISVREAGVDMHVLGYSAAFDRLRLQAGLAPTLAGYARRMEEIVSRCQAAGYLRVTTEAVEALRRGQAEVCYLSYDVGRVLAREYGMSAAAARALVTGQGSAAVPYGDWALSCAAATALLHAAGGIAVWAHPGLVLLDGGEAAFAAARQQMAAAHIDGVEAYHPYQAPATMERLVRLAAEHGWLVTGGSDWHGWGRYGESDDAFGQIGVGEDDYQRLVERIQNRKAQIDKRKTTA